jgi:hypothetical protein
MCLIDMYLMGVYHVIAAFGGRWPGVAFLILALSGKLALGPYSARYPGVRLRGFRRNFAHHDTLASLFQASETESHGFHGLPGSALGVELLVIAPADFAFLHVSFEICHNPCNEGEEDVLPRATR